MQLIRSLQFQDNADAGNRFARVEIDFDLETDWELTLNGTDDNGDFVRFNFVAIDNYVNDNDVTIQIDDIGSVVASFTKVIWQVNPLVQTVRLSADGGEITVWVSEKKLPIGEGINEHGASTVASNVLRTNSRLGMSSIANPKADMAIYLTEFGREGLFVYSVANLSANVAGDPNQGVYVAGAGDPTGGGGAWVRTNPGATPFNIKWFGAKCDGAATSWSNPATVTGTDDTAAVIACIAYVKSIGGGEIYVPAHTICASVITGLANAHNITFVGPTGGGTGYNAPPPGQIIYTGAGAITFMDCASSNAVRFRALGVRYTNAGFTGVVIGYTNLTSPSTPDCAYGFIDECLIAGLGVNGARALVSYEGAIIQGSRNSHFAWAQRAFYGQKEIAVANVLYSNVVNSNGNTFDNLAIAAFVNPGQAWVSDNDTFEGTNGGLAGMPAVMITDISAASGGGISMTFKEPWCGDFFYVTNALVDVGFCTGIFKSDGGFWAPGATTLPIFKFSTGMKGITILGGVSGSFIDFQNKSHVAVVLLGHHSFNDFIGDANIRSLIASGLTSDVGFPREVFRMGSAAEFGVGNGGGGSVTQLVSRATTVTLNKLTGQIVLFNAPGGAGAWSNFFVNNSLVKLIDTVTVTQQNDGASDNYQFFTKTYAGGFLVWLSTVLGGNTTETIVLNFNVRNGSSN